MQLVHYVMRISIFNSLTEHVQGPVVKTYVFVILRVIKKSLSVRRTSEDEPVVGALGSTIQINIKEGGQSIDLNHICDVMMMPLLQRLSIVTESTLHIHTNSLYL